ncbi:MAG: hypothetical protein JW993_20655 [Sedimentisphaerales bacterium]|nr:hypothetical protein [Sedimentisphaerales bacterium]
MNRDCCGEIEELLVDVADGVLADDVAGQVTSHLERCLRCRRLVEDLRQSIRCATILWQDNLHSTQVVPIRSRGLWRYVAVAAGVVLAVGAAWFSTGRPKPRPGTLTLAEMEQRIVAAGSAARLLAATDELQEQTTLRDVAESQYRYILAKYPDTEAAVQARAKLKTLR